MPLGEKKKHLTTRDCEMRVDVSDECAGYCVDYCVVEKEVVVNIFHEHLCCVGYEISVVEGYVDGYIDLIN